MSADDIRVLAMMGSGETAPTMAKVHRRLAAMLGPAGASASSGAAGTSAPQGALLDTRYVFAGPGRPSYALRTWRGTEIPGILADEFLHGGIVTFASAAALTLGASAVIPHYDSAEGGTHDTCFC